MLAKNFLLAIFSILFLTRGFAENPQAETFINEESFTTPSGQTCVAGMLWGKGAFESSKILASAPSGNNDQSSSSSEQPSSTETKDYRSILEFKAGYFFFTDNKMSKVFDQGGLDLQLCGSTPLWRWLQIYGAVEYLEKSGRSLHFHQKTRLWEVPISLGLEGVAKITKKLQYYLTVGPRYIFVHVHNKSHFVDKTLNENGWGGFVNTGFHFFPMRHLVIDIFGEYSYSRMHFHPHKKNVYRGSRQVGGLVFGGGIGYAF